MTAGQTTPWWRTFKVLDGMAEASCESVTLSVRGDVVVRHRRTNAVTRLDGYDAQVIELPARAGRKVWEWHTGQLWSPGTGGVYLWSAGVWQWIPVATPQGQNGDQEVYVTPSTPVRPVRTGKLLILLTDCLLALHVGRTPEAQVEILTRAAESGIGQLLDLVLTRDGHLWVGGESGLMRAELPARSVGPDTPWRRWPIPSEWELGHLSGLTEDGLGHLVMTAIHRNGGRVVLEFDGNRWWRGPDLPPRSTHAWYGPNHVLWAMGTAELWRWDDWTERWIEDDSCPAREFFDVAVAPDGSFWLATLDGLVKYSPPVWQSQDSILGPDPVLAMTEGPDSTLWMVRPGRLEGWKAGRLERIAAPSETTWEEDLLWRVWVPDTQTLWLDNGQRLWIRRAQAALWQELVGPNGGKVRALGQRGDGTMVVQVESFEEKQAPRWELWLWRAGQWLKMEPIAGGTGPLPDKGWITYLQTRSGEEWLGGSMGLVRIRSGREQVFYLGDTMEPEPVHVLVQAADGRIYAAGRSQLWCWDEREWTLVWSGSDPIRALGCGRDGGLWVVVADGLLRRTEVGWIAQGPEEGLPAAALYQLLEDQRGRLWLATARGPYSWHPDVDRDPPRTRLSLPADLELPEGAVLAVGFQGRDRWKYTPGSRLLYSYRLNAGDWSPAQEVGVAMWNDLPPGRHILQVRAIDRSGNVERTPARREFVVSQPWYREPRVLGAVLAGGVGVLFFAALAWNRHRRLRRSYAEIERQVAERTRQLENAYQELLQSQKMRALGTLAAGVAHDFNNLLSIIKGSVQVIEDHMDDPVKVRRRLERIRAMVEQGSRVVQAMLGFSRASTERFERVCINQLVHNTLALLGDRWCGSAQVAFEPAAELPRVSTMPDLVQQILLNLLFNAAEAGGSVGQIVVRTACQKKLPEKMALRPLEAEHYVELSVEDFGCGIHPENLSRIFEPFFTTKTLSSRKGVGLGLTMVYEMARRLGGGLAVESTLGKGSTFRLFLPVQISPTQPNNAVDQVHEAASIAPRVASETVPEGSSRGDGSQMGSIRQ